MTTVTIEGNGGKDCDPRAQNLLSQIAKDGDFELPQIEALEKP